MTFTTKPDYDAARDAHVAAGNPLDAFEAEHGYHAAVPLADAPPQATDAPGGLSPARYDAEKASFLASGGSEALWKSMMEQSTAEAPKAASEAPVGPGADDAPDPSHVRATYDALIAAGQTPEQVAEAFKAAGVALPGQATDMRSEEAKLHDALHPDVRPEDYHLGPIAPADGVDPNAHLAAVAALRGVFADVQLDRDVGSAVLETVIADGRALAAMTPAARQLHTLEQQALLDHLSRGNADAWKADAEAVLAQATNKDFVASLKRSGALSSASVIASLHHHRERLRARAEA